MTKREGVLSGSYGTYNVHHTHVRVAYTLYLVFFTKLYNVFHPPHFLSAVYEDCGPGAKANVLLQPDSYNFHGNDSGYHGDTLSSRHSSGRDSLSSEDSSSHGNVDESETGEIILGEISIAPEHSWVTMDTKISDVFMVCTCAMSLMYNVCCNLLLLLLLLEAFSCSK